MLIYLACKKVRIIKRKLIQITLSKFNRKEHLLC